ncbi:MAG: hypothetical protein KBF35_04140 [Saprospiraceae bacterium]|nr:hypothetical protein [Saprospiraceae bacterium]
MDYYEYPFSINKCRHYGIHQYTTKQRKNISSQLINHGAIIRTVFEILRQLLKLDVFVCHHCGSIDFDKEAIPEDPDYLYTYLQNKAPPNINTLHTGRSSNTALNPIAQNTPTSSINPTIK